MGVPIEHDKPDPTLEAANRIAEERAAKQKKRTYIGLSQIADCARKLQYRFMGVSPEAFDYRTLYRFEDGHRGEDVIIERLKQVPGVQLFDRDPDTNEQFEVVDANGHAKGHADGQIIGLIQAPKTMHLFESKVIGEKAFDNLKKIKRQNDEKHVLKLWNETYYGQAQAYMRYLGLTRSYHVVASAGCRDWISIRTNYDADYAEHLVEKIQTIIDVQTLAPRIHDNPQFYKCRFCEFNGVCHEGKEPGRDCRTCVFSSPATDGQWLCNKHGHYLDDFERCGDHRYRPAFIESERVEVDGDDVVYTFASGSTWTDKGPTQ